MTSRLLLLLCVAACNGSGEPPKTGAQGVSQQAPPDTPETKDTEVPLSEPPEQAAKVERVVAPAQAVVPGTLRLIIIDPDPPIVRKRKKRTDSKGDIKNRERNLKKQQKRIAELASALGEQFKVEEVKADEVERNFIASLEMGTENQAALPAALRCCL